MDELIKVIQEKAGIPADQARKALDAVLGFLKDKLPGGLGSQVEGFLGGNAEQVGGLVEGATDKLKGLLGKD